MGSKKYLCGSPGGEAEETQWPKSTGDRETIFCDPSAEDMEVNPSVTYVWQFAIQRIGVIDDWKAEEESSFLDQLRVIVHLDDDYLSLVTTVADGFSKRTGSA